MSAAHSTPAPAPGKPDKPAKPYPEFPLFPHAAGVWAKKICGKMHYFGPWDNPGAALEKYEREREALHAGRKPREAAEALTVKELANVFLEHKEALRDAGELADITLGDYESACREAIVAFGNGRLVNDLQPDDFAGLRNRLTAKWGHHRVSKTIQFIRCVFKYAFDAGLVDRPVRYGPGFKRPSKKTLRLHRAKGGAKLFTAEEIRRLLAAARPQVKTMILLGINCGFGNADCGNLPLSAVDLDKGIIDFPRPKTGIARRCVLWPETIATIKDALANRPEPKKAEHANLVFLTRCGDSWHTGTTDGPLSRELGKLLRKLKINGRKGLGFYTLRHVFRTVADAAKDQVATDFIMGHEVPNLSAAYRETIADERLRAVSDHVRRWLYAPAAEDVLDYVI